MIGARPPADPEPLRPLSLEAPGLRETSVDVPASIVGPEADLLQRTVRGGLWALLARASVQLLGVAKLLILARLLNPTDFGLLGIALLTLGCVKTFTETGFEAALVRRREDVAPLLDTAFSVLAARGALLAAVLFLGAPAVGRFFDAPEAVVVVRGLSLLPLLEGLTSPAIVSLTRALRFRRLFVWELAESLAGFGAALVFGVVYRNVWALVLAVLVAQALRTASSYAIAPYRPRLTVRSEHVRELARFGLWVLVSNVMVFLLVNGDDLVVGKLLGATALGLYVVAYRISNLPATEFGRVVSQVGLPALAQVQDGRALARESFRLFRVTAWVSFLAASVLAATAPQLVPALLGSDWAGMILAFQLLCLFAGLRGLNAAFGTLFYAVGRPGTVARISGVQLACLAAIILPATALGHLAGAAGAVALANGVALALLARSGLRVLASGWNRLLEAVAPAFLTAVAVAATLFAVAWLSPSEWGPWVRLAAQLAVAGLSVAILVILVRESLKRWVLDTEWVRT